MQQLTPPTLTRNEGEERVRLTISVTPQVHAVFVRMAEVSGMSLGRAMGDWLADTHEAAEFMTQAMEEAKSAPKRVLRQIHAFMLGSAEETAQALEAMRNAPSEGAGTARRAGRGASGGAAPRPVIRGGKSSGNGVGKASKGGGSRG